MPSAPTPLAAIVILAAGSGTRVGAEINKVLLPLGSSTVLGHCVATALDVPDVARIVVVVRPGEESDVAEALAPLLGEREIAMVPGGAERQDSERAALKVLATEIADGTIDVVAIHDGARPLAPVELYVRTIEGARRHGGAIPAVPLTGLATRSFAHIQGPAVAVQTPQAFRAPELLAAYARGGNAATDTAAALGEELAIVAVPSSAANLKITFADDLVAAAALAELRS